MISEQQVNQLGNRINPENNPDNLKYWEDNLLQDNNFYYLKTGISPVYALDGTTCITDSEFDDLLEGGIAIPKKILSEETNRNNGLVILLTGAPGAGKTTFALELCYRLASRKVKCIKKIDSIEKDSGTRKELQIDALQKQFECVYITNEDTKENTEAKLKNIFDTVSLNKLLVVESEIRTDKKEKKYKIMASEPSLPTPFYFLGKEGTENFDDKRLGIQKVLVQNDLKGIFTNVLKSPNKVCVIDSLNTIIDNNVDNQNSFYIFNEIVKNLSETFPISIILMDTGPGFSPEHKWSPAEYMCDLEINFSYERPENYMIRRLWIVKARYQKHADGFHRIKIDTTGNMTLGKKVETKEFATSYFPEGGIHVFSSVHRYLSEARRNLSNDPDNTSFPTPYPALNNAIQSSESITGGIRKGQCVCIIGDRGAMKSHSAYRILLNGLQTEKNKGKRGLIISLRDTKNIVYSQLLDIIRKQNISNIPYIESVGSDTSNNILKDLVDILYFWPGYISPDEFFHIVKVAVEDSNIDYVVINGLEQLSARFPLCAQEKMFISGLLTYLQSKQKIVIVTATGTIDKPANDGGVPDGLLPMGDIILQGSVVDISPRLLWKMGRMSEDVWRSAVGRENWNNVDNSSYEQSQGTLLYNLYIQLNDRNIDWGGDITQPHVVYDVVRGVGFRECRMRLLCYVTREDDLEKATVGNRGNVGCMPNRNQVFLARIPEEIASQIFH